MNHEDCIKIGRVGRLHGYKGDLSLILDNDMEVDYTSMDMLLIEAEQKLVPYFISSMKTTPKGFAITHFEGLDEESAAKRLVGSDIYIPKSELPQLEEDDFFDHELVGMLVRDKNLGEVGKVSEVLDFPGNKQLSIDDEEGVIMIPLIDEFVLSVDKDKKEILVDTPEGLLELNKGGDDDHGE